MPSIMNFFSVAEALEAIRSIIQLLEAAGKSSPYGLPS